MKVVAEHILDETKNVELTEYFTVVFGDRYKRLAVRVRDGRVEISGDSIVIIEPRAANSFWVSLRD